jgi:hypothetical protein
MDFLNQLFAQITEGAILSGAVRVVQLFDMASDPGMSMDLDGECYVVLNTLIGDMFQGVNCGEK